MKKKIKIFILDDNQYFGELIRQKLIGHQRDVHYFQAEMDLIRRLNEKPEILILDHILENCTGLEILEIVKRKCGNSTYVIYLSAQDYLNVTLKALRNGAIEYVEKGNTPLNYLDSIISKISFHTDGFSKPIKLDHYRIDSKIYELTA